MARVCMICGKGSLKGNMVPRGVGRRVTRRTIIHKEPNLRTKRIIVDGKALKLKLCASCLKRIKYEKALIAEQARVAADVAQTA